MNKFITKIVGAALGLTLAIGVGVAVGANQGDSREVEAAGDEITFGFTSNVSDWPTTDSNKAAGNKTYTVSAVSYTYSVGPHVYCNSTYLFIKSTSSTNYLGLPAVTGKKLTKVIASNSSGCSQSTQVGIYTATSGSTTVSGGAAQTWSTRSSSYTYNLTGTSGNTMYYLRVSSANAQITQLKLTYEDVGTTHKLTYAVGTHGSHDGVTTKVFDLVESTGTQTVKSPADVGISAVGAYAFDKWNDGSKDYAIGSTFTMGKVDATLTAIWVDGVGLSYNGNGATSGSTPTTYVKSGESQTVAENGFTAPNGTVFKEWNTNSSGTGTPYQPGDVINSFTSALELFAIWQEVDTYTRVTSTSGLEIGATYMMGGTITSNAVTTSYFARSDTGNKSANWLEENALASTLGATYTGVVPSGTLLFTLLDAGKDSSNKQLYYITNLTADSGNYHSLGYKQTKYVYWNSNANNYGNAFDTSTDAANLKWNITIDNEAKATISAEGETDRFLCNRANADDIRFTCYGTSTLVQADRVLPYLYKLSGSSFETSALDFATTSLKMGNSKYDGEVNTEDDPAAACASNYTAMKTAYGNLNAFVKNVFLYSANATLTGARARAAAWAIANNESFTGGVFGTNAFVIFNNDKRNASGTIIIVIISSISLVAVSSYFVIRRRREN